MGAIWSSFVNHNLAINNFGVLEIQIPIENMGSSRSLQLRRVLPSESNCIASELKLCNPCDAVK
jgi:hypothetical protein